MITGATDGIGFALARLYGEKGCRLLLTGRRPAEACERADMPSHAYIQADLLHDSAGDRIFSSLKATNTDAVDVLIHNAAIGHYGRVDETSTIIRELVTVNLLAPIRLTHGFIPRMRAGGAIIFISSIVAWMPCPNYAVYAATKCALDGFARSLRVELEEKLHVRTIHPGATRTGMHAKMGLTTEDMNWEKFRPASEVAEGIIRGLSRNRPEVTIGLSNRLVAAAARSAPRAFDIAVRGASPRAASDRKPPGAPQCVITGAADGIGRALASRFGHAGYEVVGVDVDRERMAETAETLRKQGITIRFLEADLSCDADVDRIADVLAEGPPIRALIHNAGISCVGRFATSDLARQETVVKVNLVAPLVITAELMRRRNLEANGSIVFLSSLSHFSSYPGASVYAATKDGLASYARSLRAALWPDINVLTVFPGPTRTAHARRYSPDNNREAARMTPQDLADKIFSSYAQRRPTLIPGTGNKLSAGVGRCFPRFMETCMKKIILDKLH